ncbi:hypothetical protein L1987_36577 [Smallanthus sonchifolius]|uniref:Uncharacterized protein n=1 Tax=Smallanthus sonchifolius TaxID=185202 RepID=A0ACB9HDZ7_9ASTR|nr:hypothetical protein L1987_36577 [Smallanthus sonchifolius]
MASITIYSNVNEKLPEDAISSQRGCCFWMPCTHCHCLNFSVTSNWWQTISDDDKADDDIRCWSKGLSPFKRIKEWSQFVVVPKLKTFIRQFNTHRSSPGEFKYDPKSYMLNFDEGVGYLEDDDWGIRNFQTRYSSILVAEKPSLNVGEVRPAFTWKRSGDFVACAGA